MSKFNIKLETSKIIIIGTGVFGISSTISLAKHYPNAEIIVVDRYEPPVPDSTSVDTTRCLRVDYASTIYANLANESIQLMKNDPEIKGYINPCGMTVVHNGQEGSLYEVYHAEKETATSVSGKENIVDFENQAEVFKSIHCTNPKYSSDETEWNVGYLNKENSMIDAEKAMKAFYQKAKSFSNVTFIFKEVEKIIYEGDLAKGIVFVDGSKLDSDLVIVAAGAWTSKLVYIGDFIKHFCFEVVWFKLLPEEIQKWSNMAITTNLSTGINIFPPHEGEMKVLRRSSGYINTVEFKNPDPEKAGTLKFSYPRTTITNPKDWIPIEAEDGIRTQLKEIMPDLADRPFDRTKLCWVSYTESGNFLIDNHPKYSNVILATGGSGHAWKFVSILGDKVMERINGELSPSLSEMFSWEEKQKKDVDKSNLTPNIAGAAKEMKDFIREAPN